MAEGDSNTIESLVKKSISYFNSKDYDSSINVLEEALKLEPHNPKLYYTIGLLYCKQKKCKEAIKKYNKAVQYDEDFEDAYFAMALSYAYRKENDNAVSNLEEVLRINPKNEKAIKLIGKYLDRKGRIDEWADKYFFPVYQL